LAEARRRMIEGKETQGRIGGGEEEDGRGYYKLNIFTLSLTYW
jgi:hypothetical protein